MKLPRDVVLSGLITRVQILGGTTPLKFEVAKNTSKIRRDLGQPSTFSANISGTDGDIDKW